jgi:hypothetical protein
MVDGVNAGNLEQPPEISAARQSSAKPRSADPLTVGSIALVPMNAVSHEPESAKETATEAPERRAGTIENPSAAVSIAPSAAPSVSALPELSALQATPLRTQQVSLLSASDADALLAKAEAALSRADAVAARSYFDRLVQDGDPRGAIGMARTYDEASLKELGVYPLKPSSAEAQRWYAKAKSMTAERAVAQVGRAAQVRER